MSCAVPWLSAHEWPQPAVQGAVTPSLLRVEASCAQYPGTRVLGKTQYWPCTQEGQWKRRIHVLWLGLLRVRVGWGQPLSFHLCPLVGPLTPTKPDERAVHRALGASSQLSSACQSRGSLSPTPSPTPAPTPPPPQLRPRAQSTCLPWVGWASHMDPSTERRRRSSPQASSHTGFLCGVGMSLGPCSLHLLHPSAIALVTVHTYRLTHLCVSGRRAACRLCSE